MTDIPKPTIPIVSRQQHATVIGCAIRHRVRREVQEMPRLSPGRFQVEVSFVAYCAALSDAMWSNGGESIGCAR